MDQNTFRNICDLSNDLILIIDKEQRCTYFNKAYADFIAEYLGSEVQEGDSINAITQIYPEYNHTFQEYFERALQGEVFEIKEPEILNGGRRIQFRIKYCPSINNKAEREGVVLVLTPVYDSRDLEEKLNERNLYLENVLRALDSSAMVSITDLSGKILSVNELFGKKSEYSKDELIGQSHELLYALEDMLEDLEEMRRTVAEKHIWQKEMKMIAKSGCVFWTDTTVKPILDEFGNIVKYISIRYDITEKKAALEQLVEAEQRWSYALTGNQDGVWDWDCNNQKIYYTPQWKKLLGYDDHELENRLDLWSELVHPDDKEFSDQAIKKHLLGVSDYYLNEYRLRCKDGSYIWVLDRGKIVERNTDGSPKRIVGTHTDISRQKLQERIIKDNETLLNQFLENLPIGVSIFDKEGNCLRNNKAVGKVFGIKDYNRAVGNFNIYQQEKYSDSNFTIAYKKCMETREPVHTMEQIITIEDDNEWQIEKQVIYVDLTFFPVLDDTNHVKFIYGLYEDITEQELAKIELEKSTALLTETGALAKIAGWEIMVDKDPYELNCSDELYSITEIDSRHEVSIENVLRLFPDQYSEMLNEALKQCITDREPFDFELPMRSYKGKNIMTRVMGNAESKSGKVFRVHGVIQDMTELYTIRKELSKNTDLMHVLFDSTDMGYMAFDKKKVCNFVNKRVEEVFEGIDFIGKPIYDIFPEIYGSEVERKFDEVLETNEPQSFEDSLPFLEGRYEFIINPIGNNEAGVFIRDITVRYEMQKELNLANKQLQEINESLSYQNKQLEEFTQIVSHNLRSPVANLNALINLYEQTEDDIERSNYIQMLREVIVSATNTLNELIEVIQVKKEVDKVRELIFFSDSLNKIQELLRADIENLEVKIIADFSSVPSISYPKIYLESIMQNLLTNAIKYKNPDTKPIIYVESYLEDNKIKLRVKDNGLGIDLKRNGAKIFGFRKTFHKHPDAKGLGLFITRNQIETMGGKIDVESEPGIGTIFTIEF